MKFLDTGVWIPELMLEPIMVDWPEDVDEYIFPSHTSIISHDII